MIAATRQCREAPAPNYFQVKALEEQLLHTQTSLVCAFNQLLDLKDLNTGFHSTRLAEWSVRVAQELGMEEKELGALEIAAVLHDIGKIGVPDAILHKPARLNEEEYAVMKKHPEYGWGVVRLFPSLQQTSLFILHHHERFDGQGYPGGLAASEVPLGSRIVAVIDAFDAMVSSRPYRMGLPPDEAIRRLVKDSGTQFDAAVVECFIQISQEVPEVFAATGTSTTVAL